MAIVHYGLSAYVERQGQDEVELAARKAVKRAEWRVSQTLAGLADIGHIATESCADLDLDALRRAIMTTTPIKELSIMSDDGAVRCAHFGFAGQSWPISRELAAGEGDVMFAVVRPLDLRDRALRIRTHRAGEVLTIAAYVPADMFLPENSSTMDGPQVRIMLAEGTMIAGPEEASQEPQQPALDKGALVARGVSARYPIIVVAQESRAAVFAVHSDLLTVGTLGSGMFAIIALAMLALSPRLQRANPITEMENAFAAKQFVPYYQPMVDIKSGRVVGAEVLIRWRKPDGTIVPPTKFVPLAESTGLIVDITRSLMQQACEEVGDAVGRRPAFKLSFNLAARHFDNEMIVSDLREIFEDSPIRLSQVVCEVTESQPLENLTAARRVIASLQGLGCRVAIDDVGTGHGGLSYMLKLGVDCIKLDKMFVDAIGTERYSTTIIETLVDLARNMRMDIVAEGVENFEQVTFLREHGIGVAQGHVFAPPLAGPLFRQLLDALDPLGNDADGLQVVTRTPKSARARVAA
jgi:sensor c-di-GMP phosphodiesterase-like protein